MKTQTHELKIKPEYFNKVRKGRKNAEVRFDDRGFMIGDQLVLKEWKSRKGAFTGRELRVRVTDITRLCRLIENVDPDWVVLHTALEATPTPQGQE